MVKPCQEIGDWRMPNQVFFYTPKRKRLPGKPRKRWLLTVTGDILLHNPWREKKITTLIVNNNKDKTRHAYANMNADVNPHRPLAKWIDSTLSVNPI